MLHDVEDTFLTLQDAFTTAMQFYEKGIAPQGVPLTQQQAVDILDVYDTLLGVETDVQALQQRKELDEREQQQRAHVARLSLEGHFAALLVSLLSRHLPHVHPLDAQQHQPFLALRMRSLLSLQRLLIACSDSGEDICLLCFRVVIQDGLLHQLLQVVAESPHEPLRAGVGEMLFIFLVRLPDGATGFLGCGGVEAMCRAVVVDGSPAVRTVCAGVLRELAARHAAALAGAAALVEAMRRGLTDGGAAEVRVLAAEVLERVVRHRPDDVLRDPRALLAAIRRALLPTEGNNNNNINNNNNSGSGGGGGGGGGGGSFNAAAATATGRSHTEDPVAPVEAAARLIETATAAAAAHQFQEFFIEVTTSGVVDALLLRLSSQSQAHYQHNSGNAARARTLRMLLQYTPPAFALPRQILHNRELLAILLKAIIDAGRGRTVPGEDYAAFQIKNVELALCLVIIASQSSTYREYLSRELCDYPQWGAAIKNAVVSLLNAASLDYFTNIELYDITGFHLNRLNGVNWDVNNTPLNQYVEKLFQDQVVRESAMQKSVRSEYQTSLFPGVDIRAAEDQDKKVRLTFILLVHATNITFTVESNKAAESPTADLKPNFSEPYTEKRTSLRFLKSPPAALSRKQNQMQQQQQQQQRQQSHFIKRESAPSSNGLLHSNLLYKEQNTTTNNEMEAMAIAYDKFNSSMSLVLKYTQHYSTKKQKVEDVVETEDGYLVHTSRLKNPWHTIVENQRLKTWQVSDLKVGDLFYFALLFDDIGKDSLDALVYNARKHVAYVKRELLTAPQNNRGRRWFLYDMLKNIMPKVMIHLDDLKSFLQNYGGDSIRFPIFLFREKELHFGERALHPGNVVEVIDQIRFYFSQNAEKSIGVDDARLLQLTQQLDNIEKGVNVNSLFDAYSPSVPFFATGKDEDDADGYGHGTISSDSEIED